MQLKFLYYSKLLGTRNEFYNICICSFLSKRFYKVVAMGYYKAIFPSLNFIEIEAADTLSLSCDFWILHPHGQMAGCKTVFISQNFCSYYLNKDVPHERCDYKNLCISTSVLAGVLSEDSNAEHRVKFKRLK